MFCFKTLALHGKQFLSFRLIILYIQFFPLLQLAFAWGIPVLISVLLVAFDGNVMSGEKHNPSFQYGIAQAAISVFMLVMCFIGKIRPHKDKIHIKASDDKINH